MQSELKEVINHTFFDGEILKLNDYKLIVKTGVGKVNAAYALTKALIEHKVDYIVNLGFAGATKPYHVGDVVLVTEARYHDFNLTMFGYDKGQVPGLPSTFETSSKILQLAHEKLNSLKEAKLYTGDMFMTDTNDEQFLVDMEGAALYHIAHKHQVPILSIKVVSDVLGSDQHIEKFVDFSNKEGPMLIKEIYHCL